MEPASRAWRRATSRWGRLRDEAGRAGCSVSAGLPGLRARRAPQRMLIKIGFGRRGATLVIAVEGERGQNSLVTKARLPA